MRPSLTKLLVALALSLSAGCVTPRAQQRCPDSVPVRCLTPVVCELDRARSCEVCRCGDPSFVPLGR